MMGLTELSKLYKGKLTLEIDCARLGRDLLATGECRSACHAWVSDIKKAISTFAACDISVVGRSKNKLAHELAATGRSSGDFCMIANVPQNTLDVMQSECNTTMV